MLLVCILSAKNIYADHLKGGWIKYKYAGTSNGVITYTVSFYQYSDCSEPEKVDVDIFMSVYDASNNRLIRVYDVAKTSLTTEKKSDFGPCFYKPPTVCYLIAEYTVDISVPVNSGGYVLAVQRCCRIAGIANVPGSNSVGLTYTVTIPGGSTNNDSSPVFAFNEMVAVCYNAPFTFDFSAQDPDGDSLVYSLCSGLTGASRNIPQDTVPDPPPYAAIPYISPYSGAQPMGSSVTIDPKTGMVSGTAPAQLGTYVVAVCVDEFRNGVYIAHTRKELHINVYDCRIGGAQLDPTYISCDGYNFSFKNNAGIDPNYTYFWDFGVTSITTDTSSDPAPTYIYADTGVYNIQLKAKNNAGCEDSAKAQVKIFPGFAAGFSVNGSCIINPYSFKDLTTTKYGYVNSWRWFFDEGETVGDTTQDPTHIYADTGLKTITLIATNSKGCIDTAAQILDVNNGPDLNVNFLDTLICSIDTLQLKSFSSTKGAVFKWSPAYNIIGDNSNQPFVYPKQTTTYNVQVSYSGCISNDSIVVNVTDHVDLALPPDTTICRTDSVTLMPSTNALYFSWSPPNTLDNASTEYPHAAPLSNTDYSLRASVGKCFAIKDENVKVVPYPSVNAGNDATICYGATTQLNANIKAAYFTWSPANSLLNSNTLTPIAGPQQTTDYILQVTDTLGCPKSVYDTAVVTVIPKVIAFAGNDTIVVRSEPLQLKASGGTYYHWFPSWGLSNPDIADPVLTFTDESDTVLYNVRVSTPEGCYNNDSIKIFIFNTEPQVFIPTAFTPNGDGKNDVFRPTVAGMKQFMYLRVYNRWGELLFNTGRSDIGWDGTFKGVKQPSGTYVYVLEAVDYNNKPYFKKGTFVLIR